MDSRRRQSRAVGLTLRQLRREHFARRACHLACLAAAAAADDAEIACPPSQPTAVTAKVTCRVGPELRRCGPGVLAVASERPAAFTATHQRWIGKMGELLEQSMELEG